MSVSYLHKLLTQRGYVLMHVGTPNVLAKTTRWMLEMCKETSTTAVYVLYIRLCAHGV